MTHPDVVHAIAEIHRTASEAGLITGIHAGSGKAGHAMARMGYQMITLAAESRALRRGASEFLVEANAPEAPSS